MTATTEIGLPINCDTVFVKPHVLLERWVAKANWPDAGMYWTEDFERQVRVLRDELPCLIRQSAGLDDVPAWVISTHTSKSIELPVVWYDVPGRAIVLRDNFCDIAVSVASNKPLKIIPTGIFDPTEEQHTGFDGFADTMVFKSYAEDQARFSLHVGQGYALPALIHQIMTQ